MNKKKVRFWLSCIGLVILAPLYLGGYILYISTKLLRALAYLAMLRHNSAREELRKFWGVTVTLSDIL